MHAIGIDIGGSKTHAVSYRTHPSAGDVSPGRGPAATPTAAALTTPSATLTTPAGDASPDGAPASTTTVVADYAESYAGSANIASVGLDRARSELDAAIAGLAAQGHDGTPDVVCAGAAGVDTPAAATRLRGLITDRFPGARVVVVHDTHLILAAAGLRAGIALISGTGSVAWGRTEDGRTARAGGWGYLLDDAGSGYGVARDAVRHALGRVDRGLPPDPLTARLVAECGATDASELLDVFYTRVERRFWARRSAAVFDLSAQDDPSAQVIVRAAADALTALVTQVHTVLDDPASPSVVLGGGLLVHQPELRTALTARLAEHGITDLRLLDRAPAHGAVRLALDPAISS